MDTLEHWIWLQGIFGPGSSRPARLIERFGNIGSLYEAGAADYAKVEGLSRREIERLCDKSLDKCLKIVESCMKSGCRMICYSDEAYPSRLKELYAPPTLLYCLGDLPSDDSLAIAVVGTRQITEYGHEAATRLSMGLARSGAVVVSGFALGVDSAAHKGALKAGGKTVAVIGCGLNYDYPAGQRELKRLISQNGAVISEYPPDTRPDRFTFPTRNRIIAGLSLGTLVIEAGFKSGSLITATMAAENGRDVFAVPGSIFSPLSEGTNRLIRDGAKPVCKVMDILEEYLHLFPLTPPAESSLIDSGDAEEEDKGEPVGQLQVDISTKNTDNVENEGVQQTQLFAKADSVKPQRRKVPAGLTLTQMKVYELLSKEPLHVDELALRANLELRVVLAVLTALEIQGLALSYPGRRYAVV